MTDNRTNEQIVAEALTYAEGTFFDEKSFAVDEVLRGLRDAGMLAETEWEYDVVQRPEDCTTISSLAFPTLDKAKNWRQHLRNMGHGDRLIMRRRRAGEWEEVPE